MKILKNNTMQLKRKLNIYSDFIVNINGKKTSKSKQLAFLNSIINKNKQVQQSIDDVKLSNYKTLMNLNEQEYNKVVSIKKFCEDNKSTLSQWVGISSDLDQILSGNTSYVLENLDYAHVDKDISNLKESIVYDDISGLKQYYTDNSDSSTTFANVRASEGKASEYDPNNLTGEKKGDISLLDYLDMSYKDLFKIDQSIKGFKKYSSDQLDELEKNISRMNNSFNQNKTILDNIKAKNSELHIKNKK